MYKIHEVARYSRINLQQSSGPFQVSQKGEVFEGGGIIMVQRLRIRIDTMTTTKTRNENRVVLTTSDYKQSTGFFRIQYTFMKFF